MVWRTRRQGDDRMHLRGGLVLLQCVDLAAPAAVALCQVFQEVGEQHTLCVQVPAKMDGQQQCNT